MEPLTDADIREIRERERAATVAAKRITANVWDTYIPKEPSARVWSEIFDAAVLDAREVSYAWLEIIPRLLDEVVRLRAQIDAFDSECDSIELIAAKRARDAVAKEMDGLRERLAVLEQNRE